MTTAEKICKDCVALYKEQVVELASLRVDVKPKTPKWRPAPHPGPRCATHHREVVKARKKAAHSASVEKTYGLTGRDYERLYALQEGTCAICTRATGLTKRLAVDHDHATGQVRGLLCSTCNRMLGHARDNVDFFRRASRYLINPPARMLA